MKLEIATHPFPIFTAREFLPASEYLELKSSFPKSLPMISRDKHLHDSENDLWNKRFVQRFESFLKIVFPIITDLEEEFFFKIPKTRNTTCVSMLATTGYQILPHNDGRNRLLSSMFYFGTEEVEYGGDLVFYEAPNKNGHPHLMEESKVTEQKEIMRFSPTDNLFVCWLNTYNSYHSVETLKGIRRALYTSLDSTDERIWGQLC